MIQELSFKNFLSFKNEVKFSFEATNDAFAEESQVVQVNKSTRLLRFAIIFGYNASGKSNLLQAFNFLNKFWSTRPLDSISGTGIVPFKFDAKTPKEHSFFDMLFFASNTKFSYQLELDAKQVYKEKLSYYKTTQPVMLFERTLANNQSKIQFNQAALKIGSVIKERLEVECLKNMSVFAARNQVNASIPLIDEANNWIRTKMMHIIVPNTNLTDFAQHKSVEVPELPAHLQSFMTKADFNISKLKSEYRKTILSEGDIYVLLQNPRLSQDARKKLLRDRTADIPHTFFEHTVSNGKKTFSWLMNANEESIGTIRTFGIETALYIAQKTGAFLPIDEIETSLHSKLLEDILYNYLKETSDSQIIVTTHNDGLLDLTDDLIRKDSVWFTEKQKNGSSDLYRLSDFRGLNRLASIRTAYKNKRFGATQFSVNDESTT